MTTCEREMILEQGIWFGVCPHCECFIEIGENEINCGIFRHAYLFENNNGKITLRDQINPHTSKDECERLLRENKVLGCAKPFRVVRRENKCVIEICDYI